MSAISNGDAQKPVMDLPVTRTCPFMPPAGYDVLRDAGPVAKVGLPGGQTAWAVTGIEEVRALLVRPEISSNPRHPNFPDPYRDTGEESSGDGEASDGQEEGGFPPMIITMDPPEHSLYRRMLTGELTVKRAAELRPEIQRKVDELIDDMLRQGPPLDFVKAFALPLPSMLICQLLGVSYEHHTLFQNRTETLVSNESTPQQREEAFGDVYAFLDDVIKEKEAHPTDDIIGRLITTYGKDGQLSHEMLLSISILLLLAGFETTASTLSLGVLTLLHNPEQLQQMRSNPDLAANAADEMVRYFSPADIDLSRVAMKDFELAGHHFKAGDAILPVISLANRDTKAFDHPDAFDLNRPIPRGHVGFGYGTHQCLGQNIARVELEVAFRTLFKRIPGLRLAIPEHEVELKKDSQIFGLRSLPVTW